VKAAPKAEAAVKAAPKAEEHKAAPKAEAVVKAAPKAETAPKAAPEAKAFRPRRDFGAREAFQPETDTAPVPIYVRKKSQFSDCKLFNKWSFNDVVVSDIGLAKYVNLEPLIIPHTFGRKSQGRFAKTNINVVERLVNKAMRSGQGKRKLSGKFIRGRGGCGKKLQTMEIVEKAFIMVENQTKQNPIQVFVKALENSAPREDITRVKRGGVAYSLAVDLAPMKRLDEAIKNIALAAFGNSFNKKVSAEQALADEIIAAANNDAKSSAIKRKDEVERIAKSSR
jgi:small subunit ribosomal protein S7